MTGASTGPRGQTWLNELPLYDREEYPSQTFIVAASYKNMENFVGRISLDGNQKVFYVLIGRNSLPWCFDVQKGAFELGGTSFDQSDLYTLRQMCFGATPPYNGVRIISGRPTTEQIESKIEPL